jgi:hypothetical protein
MPIFFQRVYFVDANILSTTIFCQRQYFVNTIILSTPIFCQRRYFVNANILSKPIFCQCQYFVNANILSTLPIFCRRQYFSDANILSTPIFYQRVQIFDADILLMPVFCQNIEDQAFFWSYDWGPRPPPFSPSPFSNLSLSLSQSSCVSPIHLTDGRGGREGAGEEPNHMTAKRPGTSNGKTSIVYYQTLSFFALRLKKNQSSLFFVFLNTKSLSNLFASLRYLNSSI